MDAVDVVSGARSDETAPLDRGALLCGGDANRTIFYRSNYSEFLATVIRALNASIVMDVSPLVYASLHVRELLAEGTPAAGCLEAGGGPLILQFGVGDDSSVARLTRELSSATCAAKAASFGMQRLNHGHHEERGHHAAANAANVTWHEGLLQDTLPRYLKNDPGVPAAIMHFATQSFSNTIVPLDLGHDRILVGTLLSFERLVAPGFRTRSALGLYLWLAHSHAKLCAMGVSRALLNEPTLVNEETPYTPVGSLFVVALTDARK